MTMHDNDIMTILPLEGSGQQLSTPQVRDALARLGIHFPHTKTVQRMLTRLEEDGHIESIRRGRALYWHLLKGARGLGAGKGSKMTFDDALALQTLRRFSSRQIPTLVSQTLSHLFDVAERRLAVANNDIERCYARWGSKVAMENGAFALKPPPIDATIFSTITRALFQERRLNIVYRPRSNPTNSSWREVLPLGLVEVGGIIYLVGVKDGKQDPTMYRVNRLADAEISLESFVYPKTFNLDSYVREQRQFDFFVEGNIPIALRFTGGAGDHLLESPMADDQTCHVDGDRLEVRGTVILSQRLRWWVRSFGSNVEVLEPASLRAEFAADAQAVADLYRKTDIQPRAGELKRSEARTGT
jgi:predicted DNA-binding transcriptional regulator YafY